MMSENNRGIVQVQGPFEKDVNYSNAREDAYKYVKVGVQLQDPLPLEGDLLDKSKKLDRRIVINDKTFAIGVTGMLEIDLAPTKMVKFYFKQSEPASTLVDLILTNKEE